MGSSAAEEEKRRTGRTWFDRIWNPLLAMKLKDVVAFTVYVYVYVLRFGWFRGTVLSLLCDPGHTVMLPSLSPSWELNFFH